jgi:hypothetical protein
MMSEPDSIVMMHILPLAETVKRQDATIQNLREGRRRFNWWELAV